MTSVEPPAAGAAGADSVVIDPSIVEPEPMPLPEPEPDFQAGMLTAGVWDDNLNFDWFTAYRSAFLESQPAGAPSYSLESHEAAHELWSQSQAPKAAIDISLVIDTTGSMGDELGYLQTEFRALATTIETEYANSDQRWSLVVYRDDYDTYTVRYFDFRSDVEEFRQVLAEQSFDGGGDYPEAPDQALDCASQLAWRKSGEAARLLFWVADAPHHNEKAEALADAVSALAERDIHVYPVASSGVDELTEFSMRSAAQLTLGRYLFLTDDSGLGYDHKEPTMPCYYVTGLDDAILRMVALEMNGQIPLPDEADIVRTVGDPNDDGVCELESGSKAAAL
jgi:hypothetical protein